MIPENERQIFKENFDNQNLAPKPFLQTHELSMSYRAKKAFHNISMPIHFGKITAIVGPSGCGKSSFLMCLNRLAEMIPDTQISGHIELDQNNLMKNGACTVALRKKIGMIFQKPSPFPFSIRKNIILPLMEHGQKNRRILNEKLEFVLKKVGLWDEVKSRLETSALQLSGGQQQRLCIARALALEPEILLMDEPCSALDPLSSAVVEDLMKDLSKDYTVVVVTHNLAQAKRIADYVAFFWVQEGAGSLIEFGPTKEIFENPKNPLTLSYISGFRG